MKRIDLDIQVGHTDSNGEHVAVRTVTAYTDKRYPGLAIHAAWSLGSDWGRWSDS